ncbi:MAG: diadenylate cyclase [Clostridia bacterium]|nr:diadenylate cyclase [Clostridia bacterium]
MTGLLLAKSWTQIADGFTAFFTDFQAIYALEIVCLFALIYYVSKVLRDNDATKLMCLYWTIIIALGVLHIFAEEIINKTFFLLFLLIISTFMLTLFHMEIKKSLWESNASITLRTDKNAGNNTDTRSQADTERCITDIIKALQNMSKNNVGALVVLSKGVLPKQVLQSGVEIDAEISTQLIEGVFFPKAPLHDGALIIQGHKIQAAGCFLPLTQKTSYPKEYGTRHRAAIGITEVANVTSLVVSEETGIISIVKQGSVTRYADYDMLEDALKDYYWQEMPLTDRRTRR